MSLAIRHWMTGLEDYPGWREWQRSKIERVLYFDDELTSRGVAEDEFIFSPEMEAQHAVVTLYLSLQDTVHALRDVVACPHRVIRV